MEGSSRDNPPGVDPMAGKQRMGRLPQRRLTTVSSLPATGSSAERTPPTINVSRNPARDREPSLGASTAPPARATTNDAGVAAVAPTQSAEGKPFVLERLPKDVQDEVLLHLDVLSMRRLYRIANDKCLLEAIGNHLKKYTVEVTPEHVVKDDCTKIDLKTLSSLSPCKVHIKTSVGMWEFTKKWISSLKFNSLEITVYNKPPFSHRVFDLKGLEGNPVVMHLEGIENLATADIPKSVENLEIIKCTLKGGILDIGALAASLTTLSVEIPSDFAFPCASLLSSLQHYTGKYVAGLPWSQLKTVVIDSLPFGTQFNSLEEVTFDDQFKMTFKNIHFPRLTRVSLTYTRGGYIDSYFTHDQLNRLKTFKGENVVLDDLTSLPNVEVLHVKYDQTLTRHTPLPPRLVELKIVSDSPVKGIPDQLTVFEYVKQSRDFRSYITVDSTTLKRLSVVGLNELMVECPHLEELALKNVRHCAVFDPCSVRKLSLESTYLTCVNFPKLLEDLPNLRQLHVKYSSGSLAGLGDIVIDKAHHLESVTLFGLKLGKVSLSADKVDLQYCSLAQTPSINAIVLESWFSLRSGDGVSCQELVCEAIERIPQMVEKLSIIGGYYIAADSLIGCDNLKALSVESLYHYGQARLNIPASVEKLCLFNADGLEVNVRPEQLKWYQRGSMDHEYIAPRMIANSAIQVGPYLMCKPDMLPSEQPSNRQ